MKPNLSIIVPAWNVERTIAHTLQHVTEVPWEHYPTRLDSRKHYELIVIDDGSTDRTYEEAWPWSDLLVRHRLRLGKEAAIQAGIARAQGEIVLILDADLQETAKLAPRLLEPILWADADLVIGTLPSPARSGISGLAKRLTAGGAFRSSGSKTAAPLSGQRAMRADRLRELEELFRGFGSEAALARDAQQRGLRIAEIAVPFEHRDSRHEWHGSARSRGQQLAAAGAALFSRWRWR
ncbi:glycosyltransferase family 2 protein [Paenibacillus hexagrammi]|uniref:Glycosyltransferase family 2 protein n=1 Tax=Paenibacillus hexagrammi TaxID=2908839 RepID=A0ABY3SCK7_9BACL|nr:glycosyltransferase family 2 protein [Paenibacillus sp. YPD9-1]UJF31215.1 glycosyltransferase family 2 protein [Paenibacillus sp. YPD9-1]